jgi:ketosteroid isomerase-like protein
MRERVRFALTRKDGQVQRHPAAVRFPEELAIQLEDAFILCDPSGLAELFDEHAVLSTRGPDIDVRGRAEIALFAAAQWTAQRRHLVSVRRVVQTGDTAAIVADWSPTDRQCPEGAEHDRRLDVLRRGSDGAWRYLISLSSICVSPPISSADRTHDEERR